MVSALWDRCPLSSCSPCGPDHSREMLDAKLFSVMHLCDQERIFRAVRARRLGEVRKRSRLPWEKEPDLSASLRSLWRALQIHHVSFPAVSFPFTDPIPPALEAGCLDGFDRAADRLDGDRAATFTKEKNRRTRL